MVLSRYRAAAALIGATLVLEIGCGEGIGAGILGADSLYVGIDPDRTAIEYAAEAWRHDDSIGWECTTVEALPFDGRYGAAVALDVIEHVHDGAAFLDAIVRHLWPYAACVIGTPNAAFDHLASAQSRAAHVHTYTHDELHALMAARFQLVQSFGMQDTALHLGHPEARHYLLMCGIGVR